MRLFVESVMLPGEFMMVGGVGCKFNVDLTRITIYGVDSCNKGVTWPIW